MNFNVSEQFMVITKNKLILKIFCTIYTEVGYFKNTSGVVFKPV